MSEMPSRGVGGRSVGRLLSTARALRSVAGRVEAFSKLLLGRPYRAEPLGGSPDGSELFTASLAGFDCVTYVETVLALSLAATPEEFTLWLRRIRYEDGRVEWARRNHYMTGWVRSNARIGVVRPLSAAGLENRKERVLDVVPGLPPRRVGFSCVPKRELGKLARRLLTGDLIFFASTRPHLDVFHCGILVRDGDRLQLRHAARSRQGTVEEDLSGFLGENRMAGVLVVRPLPESGKGSKGSP